MAQKSYFWDGNFSGNEIVEEYAPAAAFGSWGLVNGTGKTKIAQSFFIDSTNTDIKRLQLNLTKTGNPTGLLTIRIETDNAGEPSGTLVHQFATAFYRESGVTGADVWHEITFNQTFTLTASVTYWIVISTDRIDTLNFIEWNYGPFIPSSLAYADGVAKHETAGAWSQAALWDMMFKVMRNDTNSEYDDEEIAEYFDKILDSYVIQRSYTDTIELKVSGFGAGTARVQPGNAIVKGYLYENDDSNLSVNIPASGGANPAIHRVVLRKDTATQTVRATVIAGTPAAVPNKPSLGTGDLELAWLYITAAYNPAVDTPSDSIVYDERPIRYIQTTREYNEDFKNLVPNSEFYGWSGGANTAPDGWVLNGTPTIASLAVSSDWLSRGRRLRIQSVPIDEGIEITIPLMEGLNDTENELYSLLSYLDVNAGICKVVLSLIDLTGVTAPNVIETKTYYPTGTETIYSRFTKGLLYNALRIQFLTGTAGVNDDFNVSRPTVVRGGQPPLYRQHEETIMLDNALTDASWTASAYSTAVNVVSLASSFGNLPPYFKGVIARVRCRDSASAVAGSDATAVKIFHKDQNAATDEPLMTVSCAGAEDDTWRERVVTIPVDPNDANADFQVSTVASVGASLDVTIEITGLIT
jgi:hypothetical protein